MVTTVYDWALQSMYIREVDSARRPGSFIADSMFYMPDSANGHTREGETDMPEELMRIHRRPNAAVLMRSKHSRLLAAASASKR